MPMQEFLASYAVEVDESGAKKLQEILKSNRELAESLTGAFDAARTALKSLDTSMDALDVRSALNEKLQLSELPALDLKAELDLTEAMASAETWMAQLEALRPKLKANTSGITTAVSSAVSSIRTMLSSLTITVPVRAVVTLDTSGLPTGGPDDSGDTGGERGGSGGLTIPAFANGGRVDVPTVAMIGEESEPEYVIPVNKEERAVPLVRDLLSEMSEPAKESVLGADKESQPDQEALPSVRESFFYPEVVPPVTDLFNNEESTEDIPVSDSESVPQMTAVSPDVDTVPPDEALPTDVEAIRPITESVPVKEPVPLVQEALPETESVLQNMVSIPETETIQSVRESLSERELVSQVRGSLPATNPIPLVQESLPEAETVLPMKKLQPQMDAIPSVKESFTETESTPLIREMLLDPDAPMADKKVWLKAEPFRDAGKMLPKVNLTKTARESWPESEAVPSVKESISVPEELPSALKGATPKSTDLYPNVDLSLLWDALADLNKMTLPQIPDPSFVQSILQELTEVARSQFMPAGVPMPAPSHSVEAPVTIQVNSPYASPEEVGRSVYDLTQRYLLRTMNGVFK